LRQAFSEKIFHKPAVQALFKIRKSTSLRTQALDSTAKLHIEISIIHSPLTRSPPPCWLLCACLMLSPGCLCWWWGMRGGGRRQGAVCAPNLLLFPPKVHMMFTARVALCGWGSTV